MEVTTTIGQFEPNETYKTTLSPDTDHRSYESIKVTPSHTQHGTVVQNNHIKFLVMKSEPKSGGTTENGGKPLDRLSHDGFPANRQNSTQTATLPNREQKPSTQTIYVRPVGNTLSQETDKSNGRSVSTGTIAESGHDATTNTERQPTSSIAVNISKTSNTQRNTDVLEQMKKQIAEKFLKKSSTSETTEVSSFVPGTDVEYRTPGAHNLNKNGRVKRPMNAFMVWAREYRGRLAAAMPEANNSDISVKLGQVWAALPDAEKKRYYQLAQRIKQKHRQDFPDWSYKPSPCTKKRDIQIPPYTKATPSTVQQDTAQSKVITPGAPLNKATVAPAPGAAGQMLQRIAAKKYIPPTPGVSNFTRDQLAIKVGGSKPTDMLAPPTSRPVVNAMPSGTESTDNTHAKQITVPVYRDSVPAGVIHLSVNNANNVNNVNTAQQIQQIKPSVKQTQPSVIEDGKGIGSLHVKGDISTTVHVPNSLTISGGNWNVTPAGVAAQCNVVHPVAKMATSQSNGHTGPLLLYPRPVGVLKPVTMVRSQLPVASNKITANANNAPGGYVYQTVNVPVGMNTITSGNTAIRNQGRSSNSVQAEFRPVRSGPAQEMPVKDNRNPAKHCISTIAGNHVKDNRENLESQPGPMPADPFGSPLQFPDGNGRCVSNDISDVRVSPTGSLCDLDEMLGTVCSSALVPGDPGCTDGDSVPEWDYTRTEEVWRGPSKSRPSDDNTEDHALWPFPFPKDASEPWPLGEGGVPVCVELLDPDEPYLDCNQMYEELYPGGLHLDHNRWSQYLHAAPDNNDVENLREFFQDDALTADIQVSPVPLRETLVRLLNDKSHTDPNSSTIITVDLEQDHAPPNDAEHEAAKHVPESTKHGTRISEDAIYNDINAGDYNRSTEETVECKNLDENGDMVKHGTNAVDLMNEETGKRKEEYKLEDSSKTCDNNMDNSAQAKSSTQLPQLLEDVIGLNHEILGSDRNTDISNEDNKTGGRISSDTDIRVAEISVAEIRRSQDIGDTLLYLDVPIAVESDKDIALEQTRKETVYSAIIHAGHGDQEGVKQEEDGRHDVKTNQPAVPTPKSRYTRALNKCSKD